MTTLQSQQISIPMTDQRLLLIELFALYFLIPLLTLQFDSFGHSPLLVLFFATAIAISIRWKSKKRISSFESGKSSARRLGPALLAGMKIWLLAFAGAILVQKTMGQAQLSLPPTDPALIVKGLAIYVASTLAQEFSYRKYFFWRYADAIPKAMLVPLNTVVFAWAHVAYRSWVPVLMTLPAGWIFATLYLRHRSFWAVSLIHLVFGLTVFLLGYGGYFYRAM